MTARRRGGLTRRHDLGAALAALGCVASDEEAVILLADDPADEELDRRLARRAAGEPLAWIVGWAELAGARVVVDAGVYVPRPQTAALVDRAVEHLPPQGRLVDLCCGSGAVAAAARRARPDAAVVGVDVDPAAVRCARRNGVAAVRGDVSALPLAFRAADVVTAVPPYVPTGGLALLPADVRRHEPSLALDGGPDGLDLGRAVVAAAARLLRPGGRLLLELGGDQGEQLQAHLDGHGFESATQWTDAEGDVRGLEAQLA